MAVRHVTLLIYCVGLLVVGLRAAAQCPDGCTCTGEITDCSDVVTLHNYFGCDSKKLDKSRFENVNDIKQLCLTQNHLSTIDSNMFRTLSNLHKLDLTANHIEDISEDAFDSLTELQGVVLYNNNITTIKNIFKKNTKITFLNLASNQITEIGEKDFQNLSELKFLDLSSNQIATIDSKAFKPLTNLRYLILQSNKISYFSIPSFAMTSLQVVDFTNNNLERVPKGLSASITDLRFGKNNITKIGKNDLKHISALQLLTLNNNQIFSIHENTFKGLDNVKELWLNSNKLQTMPTKLPKNLVKLAINSNLIRKVGQHTFEKSPLIKELTLETNEISEIAPDAFSKLTRLKDLNLQSNQLNTLTTGIFKDLKNLVSLRLANNPIAIIQRKSFESLESLHTLDISYGELENATIQMDILKEMPNLVVFNLMNSAGLSKSLVDQVRNGEIAIASSVRKIDLRYNNLKNLPENIPKIFPRLTAFLLNNNAWRCDSKLLWLKRWAAAASNIKFHANKKLACCTPTPLKGKPFKDVSDYVFIKGPAAENGVDDSTASKNKLQPAKSSDLAFGTKVSVTNNSKLRESERKKRRSKRRQRRRNKRRSRKRYRRKSNNKQ